VADQLSAMAGIPFKKSEKQSVRRALRFSSKEAPPSNLCILGLGFGLGAGTLLQKTGRTPCRGIFFAGNVAFGPEFSGLSTVVSDAALSFLSRMSVE
jgi:hypothetical protein